MAPPDEKAGTASLKEASRGEDPDPKAFAEIARQVIVEWSPQATAEDKRDALAELDVTTRTTLNAHTSGGAPDVDLATVDGSREVALTALKADPAVLSAEPNQVLHHAKSQTLDLLKCFNDPLLIDGTQWHLQGKNTEPANRYGVDAASSWNKGIKGDPAIYVGIVDEGVDISHVDLAQNKFVNYWDPINGIDDDHNGYIDDRYGWDFCNNDNIVFDGLDPNDPDDFIDAHGTIVAGEVAAAQNNTFGVSGIAPTTKYIPAKFLCPDGGTIAGAIAALDYVTDLKHRHGLKIVASNNSWEGDSEGSHALEGAIQRGADAGILFVTVAGNGDENGGYDIDRTPNYPASLRCRLPSGADCMVVVTAIDLNGDKPEFANWGRRTVDLGAPGVEIASTFPFNRFFSYTGTSQAAPLVAGALALYRSEYPWASPTDARRALLESTARTASMKGITRTGGRLDVQALLDIEPDPCPCDDKRSNTSRPHPPR